MSRHSFSFESNSTAQQKYQSDDLKKKTVVDLKKILSDEGLKSTGLKKDELINKIISHCNEFNTDIKKL